MRRIRVIPVLLLKNGGLVKSVKFKNHRYVGDPINAVKIFNEKEVDELILLDIDATLLKREPDLHKIKEIAEEAFMPLAYGGGINNVNQIKQIFQLGIEKVVLNSSAFENINLLKEAVRIFGSQSIVASIDVKRNIWGRYEVYTHGGTKNTKHHPVSLSKLYAEAGVGEIFLSSIDRDGTYKGYDLKLIKSVTDSVSVPVIACGGAAETEDFVLAVRDAKASAVAAGSMFVFQRPHQAVLISYPDKIKLSI